MNAQHRRAVLIGLMIVFRNFIRYALISEVACDAACNSACRCRAGSACNGRCERSAAYYKTNAGDNQGSDSDCYSQSQSNPGALCCACLSVLWSGRTQAVLALRFRVIAISCILSRVIASCFGCGVLCKTIAMVLGNDTDIFLSSALIKKCANRFFGQ